jgi:hypothetical protein
MCVSSIPKTYQKQTGALHNYARYREDVGQGRLPTHISPLVPEVTALDCVPGCSICSTWAIVTRELDADELGVKTQLDLTINARMGHKKEPSMVDSVSAEQPTVAASSEAIAAGLPTVISGARWFWWIVGLSIVNIVMFQSGSNTSFVIGLGMTSVSDAIFADAKAIGFAIDAVVLGFFGLMGLYAQRGKLWAFYLGTVVYILDALIYLYFEDWMSVAFHGLVIFYLVKGAAALREGLKAAQ